jgi:hypothetical protein
VDVTNTFPFGALLYDSDGVKPLFGTEQIVNFVVPLPTPVDVPDGWTIFRTRPLAFDLWATLPQGSPQRELVYRLQVLHHEWPLTTPAEIAVPLDVLLRRCIPNAISVPQAGAKDAVATPDEGSVQHWSCAVIEMHVKAQTPASSDDLNELLVQAVDELRHVQIALWFETGRQSPLVSMETLPLAVPYHLRVADASASSWAHGLGVHAVVASWKLTRTEPPNAAISGHDPLATLQQLKDHPQFFAHRRFALAAETQLNQGDYHAAVISAATSCEKLLDLLLATLLWDEGVFPEDAAEFFDWPLNKRFTNCFATRLHNSWNISGDGVVARWHRHVRTVRNAAIHQGLEPKAVQAEAAVETMQDLSAEVSTWLRDPAAAVRFSRTAALFKAQLSPESLSSPLTQTEVASWLSLISRWREATSVAQAAQRNWPITSEDAEVRLVAVTGRGEVQWVLWRDGDGIAVLIERPNGVDQRQIEMLQGRSNSTDYEWYDMELPPTVVNPPTRLAPKGKWRLEYHLIPTREVMIVPASNLRGLQ